MLKNQWSKKEIEDSEYEIHHRALSEEYSFFEAVKDGNIEAVSKNLKEEAFTNPEGMGILSKNPLTNLKYHFVVTVALVTRYCIDGGMETEQAYRLSDFYIIHMDACSTIQEISDLHHEMALDFTGKMRLLQKNTALSKPVAQCIDYIYAHISARITVEDLAVCTNLSASYLSRLFKQNPSTAAATCCPPIFQPTSPPAACAFPILPTFRLQTIYHFLPRVILSRHSSTMSV